MNDSYSKLTISSNFIFTRVMRDPRLLKKLLERVMPEKSISDLNVVIEEKTFDEFYDAHGIRLDVYSENEESVFDVEMQVLDRLAGEVDARTDFTPEQRQTLHEAIESRKEWYPTSGLCRTKRS